MAAFSTRTANQAPQATAQKASKSNDKDKDIKQRQRNKHKHQLHSIHKLSEQPIRTNTTDHRPNHRSIELQLPLSAI